MRPNGSRVGTKEPASPTTVALPGWLADATCECRDRDRTAFRRPPSPSERRPGTSQKDRYGFWDGALGLGGGRPSWAALAPPADTRPTALLQPEESFYFGLHNTNRSVLQLGGGNAQLAGTLDLVGDPRFDLLRQTRHRDLS